MDSETVVRSELTQQALDAVLYSGLQTADSWSDEEIEILIADAIWKATNDYIDNHTRPGCSCDYSCTDNDCKKA